ncbi:TonB-dependent receptor [Tenacibaculum todarodis]|uniref:TonB-dependent receptor n=1 Tax=Tenacibaculum todarodis TaxID=1850252 RepID=A0A1L3JM40_9FLAO|nr:TonB-dependent receptor [Tenacibaculum todarodis]APG66220.1 TonB-dependent receptor [Tenacibaculum todarodis]
MKLNNFISKLLFAFGLLLVTTAFGQTITGKVTDTNGESLPYVNVIEKGTTNGTTTDENGAFSLNVKKMPTIIVVSSIGFSAIEKQITNTTPLTFTLKEDSVSLDEIVLTGNRSKPRTILDSAVPIDNINAGDLKATGQTSVDQMLTFSVPSYNASSQTVSDGTAHFDPADLRGLGPSRTLVLVNGKRKNQSALVYVNDTPGKGEVGVDMKSIPTAAIERVEVLRDGASAQYGSDAVAGVINIILKKNVSFTEVNVNSGVTKEGDGFNIDGDVNHTFTFADGGFVNTSLGLSYQDITNRAGEPGKDDLFGVDDQWTRDNPALGMTIGQPEMKKGDIFVNAEMPLNDNTKLYAFGGFNMRQGKSFALYRPPYWVQDPHNLLHEAGTEYQGFQPTFETDIKDFLFTAGSKFKLGEFNADASASYGSNSVGYTIGNTLNPSLGANSPTSFDAGAYAFSNIIGNFDVSRSFGDVSIGIGLEGRQEQFDVTAGQEESYIDGGAQSFPGLQPGNALSETRTNIGGYGTLDWDITDKFLISGAARYENYSDFGGNTSWKISSRYKINDSGVLRASYSTGFRAPSLHQVYLSNVQTLVSGGTISNQGTFNNVSPVIKDLGVASLFAETSKSISAGITVKASRDFTISLDYYNVKVEDRVVFSGEIGGTDDNGNPNAAVQQILDDNSVTSIKFFINAADTKTEGFDFTVRQKNLEVGAGKLGVNLALNVNNTRLEGEVKTPTKLSSYKNAIFNRKEQSRIISARPSTKFLFGGDYKINKFSANLNNTYFGEVTWMHATDPGKDQTFQGKVITDLFFGYELTDKISINAQVNNLFNVYPDELDAKGDASTDLGGRFKYPWEVNQFGFNGMTFRAGLTLKL